MIEIDDGNNKQCCNEREIEEITHGESEFHEQNEGAEGSYSLDQWILNGNGTMTITAPSPQQKIADQRNIIIKFDRFFALRAVGTRPDNRFLLRQSRNAYIQETADHRSKKD